MEQVKLKKLNAGSSRYGVCEVCETQTDTTYLRRDKSNPIIFGHLECLRIYSSACAYKANDIKKVIR